MSRYCFSCGKKRPLIMYHKDDSKYQIKSNSGKCIECRICTYKRGKHQGGLMQRLDGKFVFFPLTIKELIKYILKK